MFSKDREKKKLIEFGFPVGNWILKNLLDGF
jgi:hypothetical protein